MFFLHSVDLNFEGLYREGMRRTHSAQLRDVIKSYFVKYKINTGKLIEELESDADIPSNNNFVILIQKIFQKLYNLGKSIIEYINQLSDGDIKKILILILNKSEYKDCTVEEFMKFDFDRVNKCPNINLVRGSCSEPSFFDKSSIEQKRDIEMENLFEEVEKYMQDKSELKIVVGADKETEMKETVSNGLIVYISPIKGFIDIRDAITKLENKNITNNRLQINGYFPLSSDDNALKILNIIVKIKNLGKNVILINKICGSCFRSFYFLKNNGITYQVNPDQRLSKDDTFQIRRCF